MENSRNFHNDWEDTIDEWENTIPVESAELFEPTLEDEYSFEGNEDFDDAILDIDYSMLKGDLKSSLKKIKQKIKRAPRKRKKPLNKTFQVADKGRRNIHGGAKQINKVIVPKGREIIVEGVSEFMLTEDKTKEIGYYKGEKLKELIVVIENTSGVDFAVELFNPSMPLDFLQSTSGNLNNRVVMAGGTTTTYTDVLHNLLANPTLIPNARFTCTGSQVKEQVVERLTFVNKAIDGEAIVKPLQMSLNMDLFQQQANTILFDIMGTLDRAYIPDGMDIIRYNVLAGNTVTFCFYYKQKSLKKFFWKEARKKTKVLDEMKGLL